MTSSSVPMLSIPTTDGSVKITTVDYSEWIDHPSSLVTSTLNGPDPTVGLMYVDDGNKDLYQMISTMRDSVRDAYQTFKDVWTADQKKRSVDPSATITTPSNWAPILKKIASSVETNEVTTAAKSFYEKEKVLGYLNKQYAKTVSRKTAIAYRVDWDNKLAFYGAATWINSPFDDDREIEDDRYGGSTFNHKAFRELAFGRLNARPIIVSIRGINTNSSSSSTDSQNYLPYTLIKEFISDLARPDNLYGERLKLNNFPLNKVPYQTPRALRDMFDGKAGGFIHLNALSNLGYYLSNKGLHYWNPSAFSSPSVLVNVPRYRKTDLSTIRGDDHDEEDLDDDENDGLSFDLEDVLDGQYDDEDDEDDEEDDEDEDDEEDDEDEDDDLESPISVGQVYSSSYGNGAGSSSNINPTGYLYRNATYQQ